MMNEELELQDEEERDDEVIGVAFRWSLAVFVIAGCTIAAFFMWKPGKTPEKIIEKDTGTIKSLSDTAEPGKIPLFAWENITPDCGIDFVHFSGATGERLLPETMGGGVALFDYDNNDTLDVLLVSGTDWQHNAEAEKNAARSSSIRLYSNDGKARFTDVTEQGNLDVQLQGMGCAVGDYDNDGDTDLYITCVGRNFLFRNDGGTFTDVTSEAMVGGGENEWSSSAGFFDFNRDGLLDLMVCNYVDWSRETDYEVNYTLNGTDRAYGPPTNYRGLHPRLFVNLGDGRFEDRTAAAGLQTMNPDQNIPLSKSLGLLLVDLNRDGWDDIILANDTVRNECFLNRQDGTFEEVGVACGLAYDRMGNSTGAMGIDIGFPWNDDASAIAIGNFANEMSSVYVSQGSETSFVDQAASLGIGAPTRQRLSFGTLWEDFDLDGRVDFLQINGHLEDSITEIQPSQTFRQPAQLFWNNGATSGVCFPLVPAESAGDLYEPIVGRGGASGDLDGDGDTDLVLTQIDGPPLVLLNNQKTGNHFLRIRLKNETGNRQGFGAMILAGEETSLACRLLSPTRSYLSQVEAIASFGFPPDMKVVPLVRIRWPDGELQELRDVPVDQTLEVVRKNPAR